MMVHVRQETPKRSNITVANICPESHASSTTYDAKNSTELPEYIIDPFTRTTYVKGRFLGKGGFARVHEIRDLTTNKEYACKIIPKSRLTKPHQKEKILREVQLHQTLRHKNVVQFHHFFEDQENVYIILEFCSQKSLIHVLRNRKILTECEVRYYMHQLAQGVQYIHSQGVIHRDLKLGNMFLSEDMEVKIGDFGLATRLAADGLKKGNICGTPNYIAPEVLNMEGHGFAADIWAMGCIMYALLVGQPPFETSTLNETYARITSNTYSIPPTISEEAHALITSMLSPDPLKRPTAGQVLQHDFFKNGYMPNILSVACCKTVPKFPPMQAIPRSVSAAEHILSEEIKKMTMSTLRIHAFPKSESKGGETFIMKPKSSTNKESDKKEVSCFHKALRKKLTRVLCPDKYRKPKMCTMASLYQRLSICIDSIPEVSDNCAKLRDASLPTPLFVAKWIDYSNKYGFGFQLSDRSVGVLFNDATKISLSPDRSQVEFHDSAGKLNVYSANNVPPQLLERFVLVKYFSQYMDENLTDGGDLHPDSRKKGPIPFMRRWVRTSHTIIMQLSNNTLQINFFKDHTKIIVADTEQDGLVTYINEDRHSTTYSFESLVRFGCKTCIYTRLQYALSVLDEFAGLEGEEM